LTSLSNIPPNSFLVIGENSADKTIADQQLVIKNFIQNGGRILCLRQDSAHLLNVSYLLDHSLTTLNIDIDDPNYPLSTKSPRNGYYVNPERPGHPVFAGITRENLRVWSDYTGWDETKEGFPAIQPVTDGFNFQNK
ncbi:hypothetical protein, partial [Bradyrhizobium sp. NBAIM08]|uniref:hypothetical protein n=1 Tax=Bradyrhizobium sp. NBAIM08 TaxID=2793815 RepID=UPI001CD4F495